MITVDLDTLKEAPPPYEVQRFSEDFRKDDKYTAWRKEMEEKYSKQKAKGGIIDRDAEDSRFLVVTEGSSSADLTPSPDENRQPPADVEASAAKAAVVEPAKTSSAQPANRTNRFPRGRGKWIHRPAADAHGKERSNGAIRQGSQPPRGPRSESSNSSKKELLGEPGNAPSSLGKPPPGFEPR